VKDKKHKIHPKLILRSWQSPGDALMLTGFLRQLKRRYPKIKVRVDTCADEYFANNPYIDKSDKIANCFDTGIMGNDHNKEADDWLEFDAHYGDAEYKGREVNNIWSINKCGLSKGHFSQGFIGYFNAVFGTEVDDRPARPEVYLTDEQKLPLPNLPADYWVILAGYKGDYPRKMYHERQWRRLFALKPDTKFVQLGIRLDMDDQPAHRSHYQPNFSDVPNVIDMLDQTSLTQMLTVIHNAIGVISPITQSIVQAAALNKPCIVLAGGGEHYTWQDWKDDRTFRYLHTGQQTLSYETLPFEIQKTCQTKNFNNPDCCLPGGCWKSHCQNVMDDGEQVCMKLITPEYIAQVMSQLQNVSAK